MTNQRNPWLPQTNPLSWYKISKKMSTMRTFKGIRVQDSRAKRIAIICNIKKRNPRFWQASMLWSVRYHILYIIIQVGLMSALGWKGTPPYFAVLSIRSVVAMFGVGNRRRWVNHGRHHDLHVVRAHPIDVQTQLFQGWRAECAHWCACPFCVWRSLCGF